MPCACLCVHVLVYMCTRKHCFVHMCLLALEQERFGCMWQGVWVERKGQREVWKGRGGREGRWGGGGGGVEGGQER